MTTIIAVQDEDVPALVAALKEAAAAAADQRALGAESTDRADAAYRESTYQRLRSAVDAAQVSQHKPSNGEAFARQLASWSEEGPSATAYLRNGGVITSDAWSFTGVDGLLAFEGDGGVLYLIDPNEIVAAHWGDPNGPDFIDPKFRMPKP